MVGAPGWRRSTAASSRSSRPVWLRSSSRSPTDRPAFRGGRAVRRRAAHHPGPARPLAGGSLPRHPDRPLRSADGRAAAVAGDPSGPPWHPTAQEPGPVVPGQMGAPRAPAHRAPASTSDPRERGLPQTPAQERVAVRISHVHRSAEHPRPGRGQRRKTSGRKSPMLSMLAISASSMGWPRRCR